MTIYQHRKCPCCEMSKPIKAFRKGEAICIQCQRPPPEAALRAVANIYDHEPTLEETQAHEARSAACLEEDSARLRANIEAVITRRRPSRPPTAPKAKTRPKTKLRSESRKAQRASMTQALARALTELRQAHGRTQKDLAALMGRRGQAVVAGYETGRHGVGLHVAWQIADALGEPLANIIARAEQIRRGEKPECKT